VTQQIKYGLVHSSATLMICKQGTTCKMENIDSLMKTVMVPNGCLAGTLSYEGTLPPTGN
jgi:hypothetical protein